MFQICGHFQGSFRNLPARPQSVSPFWTVYWSGALGCRSDCVTFASAAGVAGDAGCFGASAAPGMPSARTVPVGTKMATPTTNDIIVFRMATLTSLLNMELGTHI